MTPGMEETRTAKSAVRATSFVALEPVDLRQSFNGLSARVQSVLAQDPLSGHLFLFTNRSRNRLKVLVWDGSGLWVCAKRLEKGTFGWPQGEGPSRCLRPEELSLLLHGLEAPPRRDHGHSPGELTSPRLTGLLCM
jgi:transposase